jgi:hypothetical protein
MNRLIAVSALCVVLWWSGAAVAQVCYNQPQTVYYAQPAPVTTAYYAPTTTYYAPAPATVYYAPAPVATTAYYTPAPVATTAYYAPAPVAAPIVQTRYRPILGGTVTRAYYPTYSPAYPAIAYYRY